MSEANNVLEVWMRYIVGVKVDDALYQWLKDRGKPSDVIRRIVESEFLCSKVEDLIVEKGVVSPKGMGGNLPPPKKV